MVRQLKDWGAAHIRVEEPKQCGTIWWHFNHFADLFLLMYLGKWGSGFWHDYWASSNMGSSLDLPLFFLPTRAFTPSSTLWGCTWHSNEPNKQRELLITTIGSAALRRGEDLNLHTCVIYHSYTRNSLHVVRPSFVFAEHLPCTNKSVDALTSKHLDCAPWKSLFRHSVALYNFSHSMNFWSLGSNLKTGFEAFGLESMNAVCTVHRLALSPAIARGWFICTCLWSFADSLSTSILSWTHLCM